MLSFHSFRVALAGMATALVTAGGASAATQDIAYTLTFEGHSYFDVLVLDTETSTLVYDEPQLDEADDHWGLLRLFPAFSIGDEITFTARLDLPDDPAEGMGSVISCQLGIYDCAGGSPVAEYAMGAFDLLYGNESWFRGTLAPGEVLLWDYYPGNYTTAPTASGDIAQWGIWRAGFSVVGEIPPVAAVPLPASVLMLPAGLAGLAALRRRRRRTA